MGVGARLEVGTSAEIPERLPVRAPWPHRGQEDPGCWGGANRVAVARASPTILIVRATSSGVTSTATRCRVSAWKISPRSTVYPCSRSSRTWAQGCTASASHGAPSRVGRPFLMSIGTTPPSDPSSRSSFAVMPSRSLASSTYRAAFSSPSSGRGAAPPPAGTRRYRRSPSAVSLLEAHSESTHSRKNSRAELVQQFAQQAAGDERLPVRFRDPGLPVAELIYPDDHIRVPRPELSQARNLVRLVSRPPQSRR